MALDFSWQLHVPGKAEPELAAWTANRHLLLHAWPWSAEADTAGFRRNSAVLVRLDGYVGCLAEGPEAAATLEAYARRWALPLEKTNI